MTRKARFAYGRCWHFIRTMALLLSCVLAATAQDDDECIPGCTCFVFPGGDVEIDCIGQGLTQVPDLSRFGRNLTKLVLLENEITELRKTDFANLSRLRELDLRSNKIRSIEHEVFSKDNVPDLEQLDLRLNRLQHIENGTFSSMNINAEKLDFLFLAENQLQSLPDDVFEDAKLRILDLSYNRLTAPPRALGRIGVIENDLKLNNNPFGFLEGDAFEGILQDDPGPTDLDLSYCELTGLAPEVFTNLGGLTTLRLDGNRFSALNRSLFEFVSSSLERLFLRNCGVETIQGGTFARLKALEELHLSGNRLKDLTPNSFRGDQEGELDLSILDLSNCGIDDIKRLSLRTRVEKLWLNGNNLTVINRRDFLGLEGVQELILTRSNIHEIIGTPFVNLTELRELYLDKNFLEDDDVMAITKSLKLHYLDLSSNLLTRVPNLNSTNFPDIGDLVLSSNKIRTLRREHVRNMFHLQNLNIKSNGLQEIEDDTFQELPGLTVLDIERSNLSHLPSLRPLERLENLHISKSNLKSLPQDLCADNTRLIILQAADNDITEIPSLNGCRLLFSVQLDFNKIEFLREDQFADLPFLEIISLKNNKLRSLPAGAFVNLNSLREMYLQRNHLEEYPVGIFEQSGLLTYLDVGFNNIRELPENSFANNSQLREIDFNNNLISRIHPNAFPPSMTQLLTLNISDNDVGSWELPVGGFPYLRTLSMQNLFRLHEAPKPSEIPLIQDLELTYSYHCCIWSAFIHPNFSGIASDDEGTTEPPTTISPEKLGEVTLPPDVIHTFDDNPFVSECINHPENPITDVIRKHTLDLAERFGLTVVIKDNCKVEFLKDGKPVGLSEDTFFENAPEVFVLAPPTIPQWQRIRCIPRESPLTPCENLMDPWFLRVAVWAVWVLAILGNGTVLFVMIIAREKIDAPQFFICNLAFADFCLGVYLAFLAVVDVRTYGERSFYQSALNWQLGPGCKTAGLIAIFSSELSVFILGGLTLERVHTIASAFNVNERSRMRAAVVVVIIGWVFAGTLAILPLVGVNSYTQVAVCLPFVTEHLRDRLYIGLILSVNLFTFLIILVSYAYIFCSIHRSPAANTERKEIFNAAAKIAILIVATFACWFPLAIIAYSALNDSPLVDAGQAKYFIVFVYPLNACINPFVYAIFTRQFRSKLLSICRRKNRSHAPNNLQIQRSTPVPLTALHTPSGGTTAEDLMRIRQSRRAYSVQLADRNPVKSPTPPILAFPGTRSGRRSSLPAILGNASLCAAHEQHVHNQSRRGSTASIVSSTSAMGSGANTPCSYPLPFRLGPMYSHLNRSLPELLEEEEVEMDTVREKLEAFSESHTSSESGMRRLSVVHEESESELFGGADGCDRVPSVKSANSEDSPDARESLVSDPSLQASEALPTLVQSAYALSSGSQATNHLRPSPPPEFNSSSPVHEISVSPMEERIDSQVCNGYASSTEFGRYSPVSPHSPLSTHAPSSPRKLRFHCANPLASLSSLDGNCGSPSGDLSRPPIHSDSERRRKVSPHASSGGRRHPNVHYPVHRHVLAYRGTSRREIVRIENPHSQFLSSTGSATDV